MSMASFWVQASHGASSPWASISSTVSLAVLERVVANLFSSGTKKISLDLPNKLLVASNYEANAAVKKNFSGILNLLSTTLESYLTAIASCFIICATNHTRQSRLSPMCHLSR